MVNEDSIYIMEHTNEIERDYAGKYIAVHKNEVVATGRTIHEVYEITDKIGITDPLITYVPRAGEEMLLT